MNLRLRPLQRWLVLFLGLTACADALGAAPREAGRGSGPVSISGTRGHVAVSSYYDPTMISIVPRGDDPGAIHSGVPTCDDAGVCDGQVGIVGGFFNECPQEAGDWVSLAFPVLTNGAEVCEIEVTHHTNVNGGDIYLLGDSGGSPDVDNVLYSACCQIEPGATGAIRYPVDPPVTTGSTSWVVLVPRDSFAFDVAFTSSVVGEGLGYVNVSGLTTPGSWLDLADFGYGFCYCVGVDTICEPPIVCCDGPLCAGDANADGVVDPLDSGYVIARFGDDTLLSKNCRADANCDGVIDPLDVGYVASRFGVCDPVKLCAPGGGECEADIPAVPVNDHCADALSVAEGIVAFDNRLATTDGPDDCDGPLFFTGKYDVWYRFIAPASGEVLISTCANTDFDSTLAVYSGSGCTGTNLGCSDDDCSMVGGPSELVLSVTSGQVLTIRIGGWDNGDCAISRPQGHGELKIEFYSGAEGACCDDSTDGCSIVESAESCSGTFLGAGTVCEHDACWNGPWNDDCEDVTPVVLPLDGTVVVWAGDNSEATEDCPLLGTPEVWHAFTLTDTSDIHIDFCGTTPSLSPAFTVLSPGCPCSDLVYASSFEFIDCPASSDNLSMEFEALPAGDYYLPVYAGTDGSIGKYTVNVSAAFAPPDCCLVHNLPACEAIDGVPTPGVEECVCSFDPDCCEITWDQSCVDAVELFGCADCPEIIPPPANDECDGAKMMSCGAIDYVVAEEYTSNSNDPVSDCELFNGGPFLKDGSWWYLLTTGPDTTSVTITVCQSSGDEDNDTVITLFERDSNCDELIPKACDDDACTLPLFGPSQLTADVLPNSYYFLLVDVYAPTDPGALYVTEIACDSNP